MIRDYILLPWKEIRRRKLRTWLTLIGIFIGIAAIISLIIRNPYLFLGTSFLINDINFILLNSSLVFIFCLFDGTLNKNKGVFSKFLLFIIPILGGALNALFNWNWLG